MNHTIFTPDAIEIIQRVLKHGDSVELKRENGKLVIVEIQRKVKMKAATIG